MLELDAISAMESQGWAKSDLQPAYDALLERWQTTRDRETGLRLLFLAWYSLAEPEELTGLDVPNSRDVAADVALALDARLADDPEFLFVASHMISLCPWAFAGRERSWARRGRTYKHKLDGLGAGTPPPESFTEPGAYGAYFAGLSARFGADG